MAATVTEHLVARTNRTDVWSPKRVQPNPKGGRPKDPLIESFEGNLDALIVEKDDLVALRGALDSLRCAQSIERTLVRQLLAHVSPRGGLETRLRAMQSITARLINHLSYRAERLDKAAIPELQRVVSTTCSEIEERRRFNELARRHPSWKPRT